jgi:hypothetical protein
MIRQGDFFDVCPECKGDGKYYQENPDCPSCGVCFEHCHNSVEKCTVASDCPTCNGSGIDPNQPISKLIMKVIWSISDASRALEKGNRYNNDKLTKARECLEKELPTIDIADRSKISALYSYSKKTFEAYLSTAYIKLLAIAGFLGVKINTTLEDFEITDIDLCIDVMLIELVYYTAKISDGTIFISYVVILIKEIVEDNNIDLEKHLELKLKYMEVSNGI